MPEARRTTVYLKPKLYRALKLRAAASDCDLSDLVNEAVEIALKEDALDKAAYLKSVGEPAIPFSQVVRELKRDGLL